jgi:Effector protein
MAQVLWQNDYPGIFIDDQFGASFVLKTREALETIASKQVGSDLLSLLTKRSQGTGTAAGKTIVIALGQGTLGAVKTVHLTQQTSIAEVNEILQAHLAGKNYRLPGTGSGSEVLYHPNAEHQYSSAIGIRTPPFVALAHELVHALHAISGEVIKPYNWNNGSAVSSSGAILEEARTVGLGRYQNTRISENAVRREHGLLLRTYYSVVGDCNNLRP